MNVASLNAFTRGGPYGFSFASNLTISEQLRVFLSKKLVRLKNSVAKYHKPERTSNGTIELYGASSNICSRRNSSVLGTFSRFRIVYCFGNR